MQKALYNPNTLLTVENIGSAPCPMIFKRKEFAIGLSSGKWQLDGYNFKQCYKSWLSTTELPHIECNTEAALATIC